MKKLLTLFILMTFIVQPTFAFGTGSCFGIKRNERQIKKLFNIQVKAANKADFKKFISTYDDSYLNSDGFDLETYSNLVKDIWQTYDNIKYGIQIKNISIDGDSATANLTETSYAKIPLSETKYDGELKSVSDSLYCLKKINGKWKVISDKTLDETTSMLYGEALNLNIKLDVPTEIAPKQDYTASLEFIPPKDTMAIASIASDLVEYPQKPTQEVFRSMPEDNILERIFTSNDKNLNEYIVASIGLTQTSVCDLSIKLSLTGFGYVIRRINVIPEFEAKGKDVENK